MMVDIFISQAREIEQYFSGQKHNSSAGDLAALEWALNSAREAVLREVIRLSDTALNRMGGTA